MPDQYFLNELSFEGQFAQDPVRMIEREIAILSDIHQLLQAHGVPFLLSRNVLNQVAGSTEKVGELVQKIEQGLAAFFWTWIHSWPFHQTIEEEFSVTVYLESKEVTEYGPAHAAVQFWLDGSVVQRLVSSASTLTYATKNLVFKISDGKNNFTVSLSNACTKQDVCTDLGIPKIVPRGWAQGLDLLREKYKYVTFTAALMEELRAGSWNQNFFEQVDGKVSRLNEIAETVVNLNAARKTNDERSVKELTDKYNSLYQDMFVHRNSTFCDESDTNKAKYATELTFDISDSRQKEFCPFHTKFDYKTSRLHFTWPMKETDSCIYVVHLGRKITM